jgi:hypothetical protein
MWSSAGLLCAALVLAPTAAPPAPTPVDGPAGRREAPAGAESSEELTGASPARLIPRLEIRHQLRAPEGGGRVHSTTVRMDVLFLRHALLRYELPLVTVENAGVQRSGVGDLQVNVLGMVTSGSRHAALLIGGLTLDTATQPVLGAGKQVVDFGAAAAVKPLRWWLLYGIVDQQLSFAGDDERPAVNRLSANLGSIVFGPGRDWYLLDLAPVVDLEDDGRARLFGAIEAGRLLGGRVGLFVRAGTQLLGRRQLDYMVGAGVRYLFLLSP